VTRLLSVNVGLPRDVAWAGKTVNTAIWKAPTEGPRMVRSLNIDGDRQGDVTGHGGEGRAVLVYQIQSYWFWQGQLHRNDLVYGQFGENFTVDGLADSEVCIGDRYRIGGALFEVTQPRVTCYRLGIRMNEPEMAGLLVRHGRPGFYLRVLEEGVVEAGDEITLVMQGPERMSVAAFNALLYMPGHPRDQLERALRIPTFSAGWRRSFEKLLAQARAADTITGNPGGNIGGNAGLGPAFGPPPAWSGFRPLRVSRKVRESESVISLELEATDDAPLAAALPGQYVVVRLGPGSAPALTRTYSLSGKPGSAFYRLSIKHEEGAASVYINDALKIGDVVPTSAPRGTFTLRPGISPVVLISAGIGITPVLAMLYALVAETSAREVWWLHGARNGRARPFADEVSQLLNALANSHTHVCYSTPDPDDRPGIDFDTPGHLNAALLQKLGLPHEADFYICGPSAFMHDLTAGLSAQGVSGDRIHSEIFGVAPASISGIAASRARSPHLPEGPPGSGATVSFARSGLNVRWETSFQSLLELAEACDVPARWSCRAGACHTCESGLIAGAVEYSPDPIDPPANGAVLICCSRPRSDVVIDL
jgi:ferredoxin-NADP reductase/MOSC domain-containing protein YiiM